MSKKSYTLKSVMQIAKQLDFKYSLRGHLAAS